MSPTLLLLIVSLYCNFKFVLPLCSSVDYSDKIRNILSQQQDYDIYEGKFIFLLNASDPIYTNPSGIYGGPHFNNIQINDPYGTGSNFTYFFRSSNAFIFAGCTPPKSVYFSFVSYVMDRYNFMDVNSGTYYDHYELFDALGASLNNLVWNTSSTNMSNNYDSLSIVIQTADQVTFNDINSLLLNNNIPATEINLQSLPDKYVYFAPYQYNANNIHQYNETYDDGSIVMRISVTDNQTELEQYIHTNQTVFMLQLRNGNGNTPRIPYDPYIIDPYSPHNINETVIYSEALNEFEMDLINFMQETYNLLFINETTFDWALDSNFICIEKEIRCLGNNFDALFAQKTEGVTLNENVTFIMLGLIHTNNDIQQTLYSNIVYYDHIYHPFGGLNPVINNFEYNGSALILPIKTNVSKTYLKDMYVVQLATKRNCIVGLPGFCLNPVIYGDLTLRYYLNPTTKTHPDHSQIIPGTVLTFLNKNSN